MYFQHSDALWSEFPTLAVAVLYVPNVDGSRDVSGAIRSLWQETREKHGAISESELPEIQSWRRAFAAMGMKPTQYRCASESLLRRFRKEGGLPLLHPLVDLCNAVSMIAGVPVAVFDTKKIAEGIEVRRATGEEVYTPFSGPDENPEPREVIFADEANRAHSRRWTNRQSGYSAVSRWTPSALIVAEALHGDAAASQGRLIEKLRGLLKDEMRSDCRDSLMASSGSRFEY
jgi:DNA/RNA-binding domain of Phe-tRNA-synthetase-like protein